MSKRILTIVSADYDDLECHYPILRLTEEGYTIHVAAATLNKVNGKYGLSIQPDLTFDQVDIRNYDALLIPGGWAPDQLRRFDQVLDFVKFMEANQRVIGQICHAGGYVHPQISLKEKPSLQPQVSSMISCMREPRGWISRWWWMATWCQDVDQPTYRIM